MLIINPHFTINTRQSQPYIFINFSAIPGISHTCESSWYFDVYTVTVTLVVGDINEVGEYRLNCTADSNDFPTALNHSILTITGECAVW